MIVILVRAGYIGTLRGVGVEALKLLTVVLTVAAGVWMAHPTSVLLASVIPQPPDVLAPLSFFIVVALAGVAGVFLMRALAKLVKQHASAWWNQILGGALGVTTGLLLAGLVARALSSVPSEYVQTAVTQGSLTGGWALRALALFMQQVGRIII